MQILEFVGSVGPGDVPILANSKNSWISFALARSYQSSLVSLALARFALLEIVGLAGFVGPGEVCIPRNSGAR